MFSVDVSVAYGEPHTEVQFETTWTVTCSFGPIDDDSTFMHEVVEGSVLNIKSNYVLEYLTIPKDSCESYAWLIDHVDKSF